MTPNGKVAWSAKNKGPNRHKFVGPKEVARLFNVTPATVMNWYKNGEIRGSKLGAIYRFHIPSLAKQHDIPDEVVDDFYAATT